MDHATNNPTVAMASADSPNRKRLTSPKSEVRMLTPSEIEDLRRDKETAGLWMMQEFRKSPRLLTPEELAAIA
jgi:hypothetical protein